MNRVLALALLVLGGCSGRSSNSAAAPSAPESASSARASIVGTTVDAEDGSIIAGAEVSAPGAPSATSDAEGRFLIERLPVGLSGDLRARAADGREATNPLRSLRAGRLEVVLRLRKP